MKAIGEGLRGLMAAAPAMLKTGADIATTVKDIKGPRRY
jgi:hypothetical protein